MDHFMLTENANKAEKQGFKAYMQGDDLTADELWERASQLRKRAQAEFDAVMSARLNQTA